MAMRKGDTVRVTVQGKFYKQEVEVVAVHIKMFCGNQKTTYRLATMWDEKYYPTWWDENEIEHKKVEEKS